MLDLLRDPLWQFVGVLLALAALGASFLIYSMQRQRKAFSYEILSLNRLLTVREELEGRLQVLYEGHPAKDICLVVVRLLNSGNVPIATTDFERPLALYTGQASKILSAVVTARDPINLDVDLDVVGDHLTIAPTMLNAKDSVALKLLVSDFSGALVVDGRILGVRSISKLKSGSGILLIQMVAALLFISVGVFLAVTGIALPQSNTPMSLRSKIGVALVACGYAVIVLTMVKSPRLRSQVLRIVRR